MVTKTDSMEYQHERRVPEKQMYDVREFCAITGMSLTAVRRGIREDDLPVKPIRVGGMWRFRRREVDRLVGLIGNED